VAQKVEVFTRRAGAAASEGVKWESEGEGAFSVEAIDKAERGTTIVLHLRPTQEEFADEWRLKTIIHKYAEHIAIPVCMPVAQKPLMMKTKLSLLNKAKPTKPSTKPLRYGLVHVMKLLMKNIKVFISILPMITIIL
jgi:HSP90 family molecular chaperone